MVVVGMGILGAPAINYLIIAPTVESLINGLTDGAIVAAFVGGYVLFVRDRWFRPYARRMRFSVNLLVNAFMYLVLFHLGRVLAVFTRNPTEIIDGFWAFLFDPQMLKVMPIFFLIAVAVFL